ncbi:MAG: hypothetical protein OQL06_14290 [Gammaproteobacteria bacterium]|nr:hypothetical protein [Gammaproteobacteria bacterium]
MAAVHMDDTAHSSAFLLLLSDPICKLELSVYAVYPQRRYLSPRVRAFVEFMSQQIGETPRWEF